MLTLRKERRSYIVLVLICIVLCGGVLTLSFRNENQAERRWCGMLVVEKMYPPPKPANPKADPRAERVWLLHEARLKLYGELGC